MQKMFRHDKTRLFQKEEELPSGAHLRSSKTLSFVRGFKQCKDDLAESYNRKNMS